VSYYCLDRSEMKFVISGAIRDKLMQELEPHLKADANADETAYYPIVSLYYDNKERDCYWEKMRGIQNRRKFRVRVYGSLDGKLPPTVFIEVKHKQDGRGVKRRVKMPLEEALRVGEGSWPNVKLNEVDKRTVREIIHDLVEHRGFKPVMVMRYDRRAFAGVDPSSDLRVTYDTGIAYRLDKLKPVPDDRDFRPENYMYADDVSVLEVKVSGSVPYWLSRLLPEAGCKLQSHSKYCNALERSDPVLRSMLAPNWRKPLGLPQGTPIVDRAGSDPMALPALG
jgi:VTC domain